MVSKIIEIISEQTKVDVAKISEETTFEGMNIDSLTFFNIILTFEEEFNIEISNGDAEGLKSVQDTVQYINSKSK